MQTVRPDREALPATAQAVLRALSLAPHAPPSRLVALTGRSWKAVEASLQRLEADGLVVRRRGRWCLAGWEEAAGLALQGPALRLLEAVERRPGASGAELAEATGLDPAEVSRHGKRLEHEGWLTRAPLRRRVHYLPAGVPGVAASST